MSSRPSSFVLTTPGPVRLFSTEELLTMPSPEWLIDGILPQGAVAALYGPPETFKSFVGLDIGLCVATDLAWHGREAQHGMVLYIAAEGGAGIAKRVRAWLQHHGIKASRANVSWMIEAVSVFAGSDDLERLQMRLEREVGEQPVLVIIDTLARCFVGDENQQEDMGAFVAGLDLIRKEYGATVLAIHHTNLGGERERGNTALRGASDTMIAVTRVPKSDYVSIECSKQKDAEHFDDLRLMRRVLADVDSCVLVDPPASVDDRRTLIYGALCAAGRPLSFDEWFSSVECSRSTFQRYFAELRETGKILKENGSWRPI